MNKNKLNQIIQEARKLRDNDKLLAYQGVLSCIQESESRLNKDLSEQEIDKIVVKELSALKEILEYSPTDSNLNRIKALEELLPKQIDPEEYPRIVQESLDFIQATSIKDMSDVIARIKVKHGAALDYKVVSGLVKEKLL